MSKKMSKKPNDVICRNHDYYKQIGEVEKELPSDTIFLSERANHRGIDYGVVNLKTKISDTLTLGIERNQVSSKDFKFKIYDSSLMSAPCYRFDSDGDAHMNIWDIPLQQREVKTPHFHKYSDDGIEFAYKTKDWLENADLLLSNQDLALASFAREENIVYEKLPEICKPGELLLPENVMFDPLEGEDFYE